MDRLFRICPQLLKYHQYAKHIDFFLYVLFLQNLELVKVDDMSDIIIRQGHWGEKYWRIKCFMSSYVFLFCTPPPFNVYISCLSAGFHRFQRNVIRLDGMSQFGKGVSVFIVLWYCWAISIFAHFYFVCPFDIAALIWNIINQNSLNSNSGVFFFHIIFLLKSLFGGILFTLTWVIFS